MPYIAVVREEQKTGSGRGARTQSYTLATNGVATVSAVAKLSSSQRGVA